MTYIDCKRYADKIIEEVSRIPNKTKRLLVLTAGDDPASAAYMRGKEADCKRCGIPFQKCKVNSQQELMWAVAIANANEEVGGILIQLPLPEGFDADAAINAVLPTKDVDGFRPDSPFLPCTPEGIMYILDKEIGDLSGKNVLLIGKGKLVGKPLIPLLLERGCTLTIAHSRTKDLKDELFFGGYDIVISAVGKPKVVDLYYTVANIVVDAGISRDENGSLCGDCFCSHYDKTSMKVTPVPGGVGLMTRAMLMKHMGEVNRR